MPPKTLRLKVPVIGKRKIVIDLKSDAPASVADVTVAFETPVPPKSLSPAQRKRKAMALAGSWKGLVFERLPQDSAGDVQAL